MKKSFRHRPEGRIDGNPPPASDKERYPVATIVYYGPDDITPTKVVVGIVHYPGGEPTALRKWYGSRVDTDRPVQQEILEFIKEHGARSVVATDGILGCPHEEGIDYPEGEDCSYCPFWQGKQHTTGYQLPAGSTTEVLSHSDRAAPRFAVAIYSKEQWPRLLELAADREKLETSWEEWLTVKKKSVARLRKQGSDVYEVTIDVDALDQYCRQRGLANDSAARAEYAAYLLRLTFREQ